MIRQSHQPEFTHLSAAINAFVCLLLGNLFHLYFFYSPLLLLMNVTSLAIYKALFFFQCIFIQNFTYYYLYLSYSKETDNWNLTRSEVSKISIMMLMTRCEDILNRFLADENDLGTCLL